MFSQDKSSEVIYQQNDASEVKDKDAHLAKGEVLKLDSVLIDAFRFKGELSDERMSSLFEVIGISQSNLSLSLGFYWKVIAITPIRGEGISHHDFISIFNIYGFSLLYYTFCFIFEI